MPTMSEVEILKLQIKEQTAQIYSLYKRIDELHEILKTRDTKQQKNL